MAVEWFYADAQRQQQGPVPAAKLAELFRSGAVNAETLVWRDGLAAWMPLRSVAAQIGLIVVGAPAPAPAAMSTPQGRVVKPSGGSSGTVGIVIGVLVAIFLVIPILAAIALPAYQDYSTRAKVAQTLIAADELKIRVSEFRENEQRCPKNEDTGFGAANSFGIKYISAVEIGPLKESRRCAIRLTFQGLGPSATDGKRLLLSLGDDNAWQSSSDLPPKFLPQSLRQN